MSERTGIDTNGNFRYNSFKSEYDSNTVDMNDKALWWDMWDNPLTSDIVDHSDNAKDALEDTHNDFKNETSRILTEVEQFYNDVEIAVQSKITELQGNGAPAADIQRWRDIQTQATDVVLDMRDSVSHASKIKSFYVDVQDTIQSQISTLQTNNSPSSVISGWQNMAVLLGETPKDKKMDSMKELDDRQTEIKIFQRSYQTTIDAQIINLQNANAPQSEIDLWADMRNTLDTKTADVLHDVGLDYRIHIEHVKAESEVDQSAERIDSLKEADSENDRTRAVAQLDQQIQAVNKFGGENAPVISGTLNQIRLLKDMINDQAIARGQPLIVTPTMEFREDPQLPNPEVPQSDAHAKKIYTDHNQHTFTHATTITAYYAAARTELNNWKTKMDDELSAKIAQTSGTNAVENRPKYAELKNMVQASYDEALIELNKQEGVFKSDYNTLGGKMRDVYNDINNNRSANQNTNHGFLINQATHINNFLDEHNQKPRLFVEQILENLEQPYREAIDDIANPQIDGQMPRIAFSVIGNDTKSQPPRTPSEPDDHAEAITSHSALRAEAVAKHALLAQEFQDLRTYLDNEQQAKLEEIDSFINSPIYQDDKERYEKIRSNYVTSMESVNSSFETAKEKMDNDYATLIRELDKADQSLIHPTGQNPSVFKDILRQSDEAVKSFNNNDKAPETIRTAFDGLIKPQYEDVASKTPPDEPPKVTEADVVVPPADTTDDKGGPPSDDKGAPEGDEGKTDVVKTGNPELDKALADVAAQTDKIMASRTKLQEQSKILESTIEAAEKARKAGEELAEKTGEVDQAEVPLKRMDQYIDDLKAQKELTDQALKDSQMSQAIDLAKQVNTAKAAGDVAKVQDLAGQLKTLQPNIKSLEDDVMKQQNALIDKYEDDRAVRFYMNGTNGNSGLASGNGLYNPITRKFISGSPNVETEAGGFFRGVSGKIGSGFDTWDRMKKDAGRYGSQGYQDTLNYIENGAMALGSLWAIKHGMNMAGVDNKLIRGAVMVGVLAYFYNRLGTTGKEMHDHGSSRLTKQMVSAGAKLNTGQSEDDLKNAANNKDVAAKMMVSTARQTIAAAEKISPDKVTDEQIIEAIAVYKNNDGTPMGEDKARQILADAKNAPPTLNEVLVDIQSEEGGTPTNKATEDVDANPVSQGNGSTPTDIAKTTQVVDAETGADAANDDPELNKGLVASR